MKSKAATLLATIAILSLAPNAWCQTYSWYLLNGSRTPTPVPFKPGPPDALQVRYAGNLNIGDSVVNISNAGTQGGTDADGSICANVYVYRPDETIVSCCSCQVTPNALVSLSAVNDLISNPLTPAIPTSIVIKLLATKKLAPSGSCNAANPTTSTLTGGMRAWGTTLHAAPTTPVTYAVSETQFSPAVLSQSELKGLVDDCAFIQEDGGGYGICRSCRLGGM
jgi:hypothetical protein